MKKYAIGFICGVVAGGLVFVPVLKSEQQSKYELGTSNGRIQGIAYTVRALESEFGFIDSQAEYRKLYSVKTSDVVSVEINGVKTVRVIP